MRRHTMSAGLEMILPRAPEVAANPASVTAAGACVGVVADSFRFSYNPNLTPE